MLDHRAIRTQVPAQDCETSFRRTWFLAGGDHVAAACDTEAFQVLADRGTGDGHSLVTKQWCEFLHHRRHSSGIEQFLHLELPRRLEVHQPRGLAGEFVKPVKWHRNSESTGNRHQMDDGVG